MKETLIKIFNFFGFYRKRQIYGEQNDEINERINDFISNYSPSYHFLETFFSNIKMSGLNPKVAFDVGSHKGGWTRSLLNYFDKTQCHLFEPQIKLHQYCADLSSKDNISIHTLGVGEISGKKVFTYVDREDSCTFSFSENEAKEKGFRQELLEVVSLNDFASKGNIPIPEIIKIDAECLDLEVLKGATNLLGKVDVILVECAVGDPNLQNEIYSVINFMYKNNYRIFEVTDMIRSFGNITWMCEIAFVLKDGIVDSFDYSKNSCA